MSYIDRLTNIKNMVEVAQQRVCERYGLSLQDIEVRSRRRKNSQSRFAVWYILYKVNGLSLTTIAEIYNVDHTSIMYGIRRAKKLNIPAELGMSETGDKAGDSSRIGVGQPGDLKVETPTTPTSPPVPVDNKG